MKFFASKIGTTHFYDDKGKHQVATLLRYKKTVVGRIKTEEKDGYDALVMVQDSQKAKPKKTLKGQFKNLNIAKIAEERISTPGDHNLGDELSLPHLAAGDLVTIESVTKGKGFQGTVKRHKFNTGPKSHGSRNYRRPGSIGMTTPSRVTKGKPMAGQMGNKNITVKKIKIEKIDEKNQSIWVKGHVPGPSKQGLMIIK